MLELHLIISVICLMSYLFIITEEIRPFSWSLSILRFLGSITPIANALVLIFIIIPTIRYLISDDLDPPSYP